MILDEKIEIKVHSKNITKLKVNGYKDIKIGDIIYVSKELLPLKSHIKVNVVCDVCGKYKNIQYRYYNDSISKYNYYSCSSKCAYDKNRKTNLEKYGVENISSSELIKEKRKKTNLEKYGVENISSSELIKEKRKKTNLEKYGVENISSSESIKEKRKKTNLEKYGNEIFVKSGYFNKKVNFFRNISNPSYIDTIRKTFKRKI